MPPASLEERYGNISSVGSTMPSLGLAYLASFIRQYNYSPFIIEPAAFNLGYSDILDRIRSIKPAYVGISSSTTTIVNAAKMAELIKAYDPGITTIIGGPHITAVPYETMVRFKHFDIGVIGEGEFILRDLLEILRTNGDLRLVHGIALRDKNGSVIINKRREYIEDLDILPMPAWDLIPNFPNAYRLSAPMSIKKPEASIITSRGCPHECIFCDRSVFGHRYRLHSAAYVVESFQVLKEKFKVKHIMIYDDTFIMAKKRVHDICEKLIKIKNDVIWSCLGNINVEYDTLALIKKAGCWQIGFGIESGSERILKMLKKRQTIEDIRRAITISKKVGIKTRGFFIIGSPGESRQDIRKTIDLAKELPLDDFQMTNFTPFPGSEAYSIVTQYGEFDSRWEKMNILEPIFVPNSLTKEELTKLQNDAHKEFYLRFHTIWNYFCLALKYPRIFINISRGIIVLLRMLLDDLSRKLKKALCR